MPSPRRFALPFVALIAAAALWPTQGGATAAVHLFKIERQDIRAKLYVKGGKVVRVHIRARERCGETDATGFASFNLFKEEAIVIRPDRGFHYGANFDDARGFGSIVLDGVVHQRSIVASFSFKNNEGVNCGTGRPGARKVEFRARLAA